MFTCLNDSETTVFRNRAAYSAPPPLPPAHPPTDAATAIGTLHAGHCPRGSSPPAPAHVALVASELEARTAKHYFELSAPIWSSARAMSPDGKCVGGAARSRDIIFGVRSSAFNYHRLLYSVKAAPQPSMTYCASGRAPRTFGTLCLPSAPLLADL